MDQQQVLEKAKIIKSKIETLINIGKIEEAENAITSYERVLPVDSDIISMKSIVAIYKGNLEEARQLLLKGLENDPFSGDLTFNLAYVYEKQGNYQKAYDLYIDAKQFLVDDKIDVEEAIERIKNTRKNITTRKRIVFFVKKGLDSFLDDIIEGISREYHTKKIVVQNYSQIDEGMKWADICWFEWCDDLIIYGSALDLAKNKNIICRLHSYEAFTDYIFKVQWDKVNKVIFVANHIRNYVLNQLKGLKKEKTIVIPNGINLEKISFKKRKPGFNIAYVGYINHKKGPMLLIHTFKSIFEKDNRFKLYIAGLFQDPRYVLYFKQMIKELGLEHNVFYEGWQPDINQWLEDKNYIISTSVLEGNPLGIMEAMAKGIKPVIHNFVGSREQFGPYVWNTINEAVNMIISDKYDSEEYRRYIEKNFSLQKQLTNIYNLINSLKDSGQLTEKNLLSDSQSQKTDESIKEYYDNFLQYLKKDRERENPRHKYLKKRLSQIIKKGQKVLDLGCGIGITTEYIYSLGVSKVVGVDISPKLIEYAKQTVKGAEFIVHDITNLRLKEKFDVILMRDVMEHIAFERYDDLFVTIKEHLEPNGLVYISIPDSDYMSFINKNRPDLMQIIDNSITFEQINYLCRKNDLRILLFNVYGIFIGNEYNEYLLCNKTQFESSWYSLIKRT
ncbi:methyltransferase domain-containing protein [Desulfofundulus thermocisternus]|uniref:methyltransferase domain-containing protein n=1 Tax=Desulfofundulus thermocisternus TaxID=42471 RepID=UPI0006923697|nr:methyltransferase domain-containing protein [Desulfofundulus thermocisternus]